MAASTVSAFTGFTNLPNEILEKISSALLEHHGVERNEDEVTRGSKRDLASFALTDKHVYEVVIPLLYKNIQVSTAVARPLLETVLQNKKLAGLVKEIYLTFRSYDEEEEYGYKKKPLTTRQSVLFANLLRRAFAKIRFDGKDPAYFFDTGESPATEAALLLYALPNLQKLQFPETDSATCDMVFRSHHEISSTIFRQTLAGVDSTGPATVPDALLCVESFVIKNDGPVHLENGLCQLEPVACVFFWPKIRTIELSGMRSAFPFVTTRDGKRREGFAPSIIQHQEFMNGFEGPSSDVKETDSDGEEDGLNGQCHKCRKPEDGTQTILKCCNKCKKRAYCCKQCQIADWPSHKKACKKEKMHHKFPRYAEISEILGSSPLEHLSLYECDIHPKILKKILLQPRALKVFTYTKYWFANEDLDHHGHLPMKPELLQLALEGQQDSLEMLEVNLRLHAPKSIMSLRHFKSLKHLNIEALLLAWRPSHSMGRRVPICDSLPPSLKTLELKFRSWCDKAAYHKRALNAYEDNTFEALEYHLKGIASRSPPLEKLVITLPQMRRKTIGPTPSVPEEWESTKVMAEKLFRSKGTELVMEFRVLEDFRLLEDGMQF